MKLVLSPGKGWVKETTACYVLREACSDEHLAYLGTDWPMQTISVTPSSPKSRESIVNDDLTQHVASSATR